MSEYYLTKDELYHHGIKGQKWGNRRWQNEDGSLTPAGREHYGYGVSEARGSLKNARSQNDKAFYKALGKSANLANFVTKSGRESQRKAWNDYNKADANWRAAKANVKAAKKQERADRKAERIAKDQAKFDKLDKDLQKARNGASKSDIVKKQYISAGKDIVKGAALTRVSKLVGGALIATGHKKAGSFISNFGYGYGIGMQAGGAIKAIGTTSYALNKKRK